MVAIASQQYLCHIRPDLGLSLGEGRPGVIWRELIGFGEG